MSLENRSEIAILDFDGTVTNVEEEGRGFIEGYYQDVAKLLGLTVAQVTQEVEDYLVKARQRPDVYGFKAGGQIVAPDIVDPYLRTGSAARDMIIRFRPGYSDAELDAIRDQLYRSNYAKTGVAFKPDALEVLKALKDKVTHLYIVTNSGTDAVKRKIETLGNTKGSNQLDWLLPYVVGDAKKFILGDVPENIPTELRLPGLDRPVFTNRMHYYKTLDGIRDRHGKKLPWSVIGDIFELDLATPLVDGARVALVTGEFTPQYEVDFVNSHPRARRIDNLPGIVDFIEQK